MKKFSVLVLKKLKSFAMKESVKGGVFLSAGTPDQGHKTAVTTDKKKARGFTKPTKRHEILKKKCTRARHGLGTAEAAHGGAGRVGVGEHDEEVADRQAGLIAWYRGNDSNFTCKTCREAFTKQQLYFFTSTH